MNMLKSKNVFCSFGGGLALLVAVGCSTPQAPSSPYTIWRPEESEVPGANEWSALRESTPVITGTVALAELVDQAIQVNPALRQGWQQARGAEFQMKQTKAAYYPALTVEGQGQSGRTDNNALNEATGITSYGPTASLQWLLLDLGGRSASVKAAAQTLLSSNYNFNQTFQDLLRDVQAGYYSLYSAQSAVTAAQANVDASLKTLEAAQQREAAGLGIHLDVLQAQSDYDKALYDLEDAQNTVQTTKGQLAQAVGLPADADFNIMPPEKELPTEDMLSEETISVIIDDALAARPDVAALRATLKAARYSVESSDSDLWPQLVAGGQADKTWNRYSLDGLDDNDTYSYMGSLALTWDVFDGFLTVNKKRAAEATMESAREQLKSAELAASSDVWSKYYTLKSTIRKQKFAEASLASAQEGYTQALDSYNAGLKDITFLLNSQSQLSGARSTMVSTQNDLYIAYIQLAHATGVIGLTDSN